MSADRPAFLKQIDPVTWELTFSSSGAEKMMLCPAKFSWTYVTEIEAAAARAGMNYGKAWHLLLDALYEGKPFDAREIVTAHFEAHPQPELNAKGRIEWRTAARALQGWEAYLARFGGKEDWEVLGVEEPFEVELGRFVIPGEVQQTGHDTTVIVKFRGIRDLRVRWHESIWVVDHKTSSEWSDLTIDEGKASFQFMGYAWVERLLNAKLAVQTASFTTPKALVAEGKTPVGGVIGNYIIGREPYRAERKPTPRDLPRDQFERQAYPYSDAQLDEWHGRAMGLAQAIWTAWRSESWPQHSTACAHWGRCEYYQLCWETDPAYRLAAAMGADYQPRTPSPFEETL